MTKLYDPYLVLKDQNDGPARLTQAVTRLLEPNPPDLVVIKGLVTDHDLLKGLDSYNEDDDEEDETKPLSDALTADGTDYLRESEVAVSKMWRDERFPDIGGWVLEVAAFSTRDPHFDSCLEEDYWRNNVPVIGMSLQIIGDQPTRWRAKAYSDQEAQAMNKNPKELVIPESVPWVEQFLGDAVVFSEYHHPTLHELKVPSNTDRLAHIYMINATNAKSS